MPILKFDLPAELMEYLQRRAQRTGRTVPQTLETIVRESQTYDSLVAKMAKDPLGALDKPNN